MFAAMHRKVVLPVSRRLVAFYSDFIVVNRKGELRVLSSHCTHLGCIINKEENGRLVCPCHGSEFDLKGKAVKGPAYKPLKTFSYTKSADDRQIIIQPADL